jgi:NIPSNAP
MEVGMDRRDLLKGMSSGAMMAMAKTAMGQDAAGGGGGDETVYELREYHLNEGKQDLIVARFRGKEREIFARYGMEGVGYWVPTDEPLKGRTIVYMLRHQSRAAADASWAKFRADPEWIALKAETEKDGVFVAKVESTFLKRTDFSPKV